MASNAKKSGTIRLRRHRKAGRARKKQVEREGTTKSEAQLFGNTLREQS